MSAAVQGAISKRRKFVADGVFYAELNEFFQRELAEEGYSGVEVRVTPTVTDISTFIPHRNVFLPLDFAKEWQRKARDPDEASQELKYQI